jgi:predicted polyphosphate/ATP-dependent NAD kinase
MKSTIGIIANPASGKDIRRIVAYGSLVDNHEKINILARVFCGLEVFSVEKIYALGDPFGLAIQAYEKSKIQIPIELSDFSLDNSAKDSLAAAKWMKDNHVSCIITLGGDGTNRVVAKGCEDIPILPLSTGTNNVFPKMMESTLAGIAAAAVAGEVDGIAAAIQQTRVLEILKNHEKIDTALIDVVVYEGLFRGSGAMWDPSKIHSVILAQQHPAAIGAAAIANSLACEPDKTNSGVWIEIGGDDGMVKIPFAPGLILPIPIKAVHWISVGESITLPGISATLALDGEREIFIREQDCYEIRVSAEGPRVINVERALEIARQSNFFVIDQKEAAKT